MTDLGPCSLCDEPATVTVNGAGYCRPHLGDGFRAALRGVAILRGRDPDDVERLWREDPTTTGEALARADDDPT